MRPHAYLDRIDLVVLRDGADLRIAGTPAANPVPPRVLPSDIILAEVRVHPNGELVITDPRTTR
jgi:hypothetical protein